jgi:integrase
MGRISDFLDQYHSVSTRKTYASGVNEFLRGIYRAKLKALDITIPRIENQGIYEEMADWYFSEQRDPSEDLIAYAGTFTRAPATTARTRITSVKEFLIFHDIEIRDKDARTIRRKIPKGGAVTVEQDLDAATLQSMLMHAALWLRAMILLMASSGMRIGEVLALQLTDIDLEGDIGVIQVRSPKGGVQRYCFCSIEAADTIREWLKKREAYLKSSLNKGRGIGAVKDARDPRVFPMSRNNVDAAWENVLVNSDHHSRDRVTKRLQIHPHMLRKYFSSQLSIAIPREIVELLMGHKGYLSDAYRRYTRKQVEEMYRKGEAFVTVQMSDEVRELRTNTDKRMQAHSELLESLLQKDLVRQRELEDLRNLTALLQRSLELERE